MFFDIVFHKQIYSDYSPAACVQMLTNTSSTQQDIYFKMMRVAQSLTNKQCQHKAQFYDLKGPIVGPRERTCILLEETLNHFKTNSFIWHVAYCKKFEIAPALVIFHPRKGFMNQMLKGHPVIVTRIVVILPLFMILLMRFP